MADLTKDARASMDASTGQFAPQITGDLYAGEALGAVAPCYIATDGKVYQSTGAAANAAARVKGFTPKAYGIGQAVAIFGLGARFRYGTALTPGALYYLSATAGALADAPTTGGTTVIAHAVTATDIVVGAPIA